MACSETQKLVAEYLGGEMTAAQRAACEYHFSQCADCQQAVDSLAGSVQGLLRWEVADVPEWDRASTMLSTSGDEGSEQTEHKVVSFARDKVARQASDEQSAGPVSRQGRADRLPGGWQSWLPLAATVALAVFLGWNQNSGLKEQELLAYLDAFEQRQQAETQRLLDTALQEFGDSTSESMVQLVEWIEAQRAADMQQLQASFQQMLNHDYQALNSMQQLASWASTQEP